MKRAFRRADAAHRVLWKETLIGEVMDGQDRGHLDAGPGEVGRYEGCLPVIGMHQVGCPIPVQSAGGKLGRGGRKAAETDVVVRPVLARFIAVGIAGSVIELWAEQDV